MNDSFHTGKNKDFRNELEKRREDNFVSKLLTDEKLYSFASSILYKIIQHSKKIGFSKKEVSNIVVYYNVGNIIIKLGYTPKQSIEIYDFINENNFLKWNKENNISLLQIMSAFYKFQVSNDFVRLCIEYDKELKNKFMITVYNFFKIPTSMNYEELKTSIINKSYGKWFYLWVITFLQSSKNNLLHRHSDSDAEYVRYWNTKIEFEKDSIKKYKTYTLKKRNIKYKQLPNIYYPNKTIVRGNTFMVPRENSIWFNIMRKYKKEIIAGPSSSAILCHQLIFEITKILSPTLKNKILLLLCIIADYSQYYHSISEVLQTFTEEANLPKYTLNYNDIDYLTKLYKFIYHKSLTYTRRIK